MTTPRQQHRAESLAEGATDTDRLAMWQPLTLQSVGSRGRKRGRGRPHRKRSPQQPHLFRRATEGLLCIAIAVILCRSFQVEGYMISTGSMAPTLLGFHKRVTCPECSYTFARGVAFDEDYSRLTASESRGDDAKHWLTCPHCGQTEIDIRRVPRIEGDQLLVNKQAFAVTKPERWDVVVFLNPANPLQAYVKRVAGLPGEAIQIRDGDVYIDGQIERKTLDKQRAVRILTFDQAHAPEESDNWEDRWTSDDGLVWRPTATGFRFDPAAASDESMPSKWTSLIYRHWIRSGGRHRSVVPLAAPPETEQFREYLVDGRIDPEVPPRDGSDPYRGPVQYDLSIGALTCRGAMSRYWRTRMLKLSDDHAYQRAIHQLYERSHLAPIFDDYGYNHWRGLEADLPVRDTMLEVTLADLQPAGDADGPAMLVFELAESEEQTFRAMFDLKRKVVVLTTGSETKPLRVAPLPEGFAEGEPTVELSLFDRQVILAVDREPLFEPYLLPESVRQTGDAAAREPARLSTRGLSGTVTTLKLYRDVHYTRGRGKHAIDSAHQLADDEYFMLGDNSPVSSDSRSWEEAGVPAHLLLGKPFLVHLPSQPGRIRIGEWIRRFRLPDPERIRRVR